MNEKKTFFIFCSVLRFNHTIVKRLSFLFAFMLGTLCMCELFVDCLLLRTIHFYE